MLVRSGTNNEAGDDNESLMIRAGKNNEADDDKNESVLLQIMKAWAVLVWSGLCCRVL